MAINWRTNSVSNAVTWRAFGVSLFILPIVPLGCGTSVRDNDCKCACDVRTGDVAARESDLRSLADGEYHGVVLEGAQSAVDQGAALPCALDGREFSLVLASGPSLTCHGDEDTTDPTAEVACGHAAEGEVSIDGTLNVVGTESRSIGGVARLKLCDGEDLASVDLGFTGGDPSAEMLIRNPPVEILEPGEPVNFEWKRRHSPAGEEPQRWEHCQLQVR